MGRKNTFRFKTKFKKFSAYQNGGLSALQMYYLTPLRNGNFMLIFVWPISSFLKMYPVIKLWITHSIHLSVLKMTLFLTSAILVCLLFVVDPKTCSCSSRFRSSSIWSFALAFCTLRCAFCSSNSRNLFVTQSLIRAALASTALASASRKAFCKKRPKRPKFRKTFGTVLYYLVGVTLKDLDLCAFLKSLLGFFHVQI